MNCSYSVGGYEDNSKLILKYNSLLILILKNQKESKNVNIEIIKYPKIIVDVKKIIKKNNIGKLTLITYINKTINIKK